MLYICYIHNIVRNLICLVNKALMTSQKVVYIYFFKKDLNNECESANKQIKYFLREVNMSILLKKLHPFIMFKLIKSLKYFALYKQNNIKPVYVYKIIITISIHLKGEA